MSFRGREAAADASPKEGGVSPVPRRLRVLRLGLTPYAEALGLQRRIAKGRAEGKEPDTLILLEHPPTITLGRSASGEHVLFPEEALAARGVELRRCDRGGDATFHGPGQLVAYPIMDLFPDRCAVKRYVGDLEEVMIRCCRDEEIEAHPKPGMNGTWLGNGSQTNPWRKVGAVGVHISRWITTHGLALNVSVDLSYFGLINPCGITEHAVTSLAQELRPKAAPSVEKVADRMVRHFSDVFGSVLV